MSGKSPIRRFDGPSFPEDGSAGGIQGPGSSTVGGPARPLV